MKHLLAIPFLAFGLAAITAGGANAEGGIRLAPIKDKITYTECSACHMAYPAGLLPKASWNKIMDTLPNHFGEDASLDPKAVKHIRAYLTRYASTGLRVDPAKPVIRITKFNWFNRIHGAGARAYAKNHSSISTISNCAGCHRGAEKGYFSGE